MIDEKNILEEIHSNLYRRDVDFSINIFLCGAKTSKRDSIRDLLNSEFKKDAKFNSVYPEYIFSNLYRNKNYNLLELEDELAKYVDLIIIPLEGIGTYCELGAFAVNKELLPKIIVINESRYKKSKSFISLGPLDLIKKNNPNNIIYYEKGKESEIIPSVVEKVRFKRIFKKPTYELENLFNLSRFILFLIAIFQPISIKEIERLMKKLEKNIKVKFIESGIQILTQKNRIEQDIDSASLTTYFSLSEAGHNYVYEELIKKLKVKQVLTKLRIRILNERHKPNKKNMSKVKELLVLD